MKEANGFYMYVSTRACYDPAKTIFVFAPGEMAADLSLCLLYTSDAADE